VSAGAMIACACDEIVMTPVGKLGDCAPISLTGELKGVEREKLETVIREEFAESAERNGYSVPLAESMVTIGREVWLIRNLKTRELRYVPARDWKGKVRLDAREDDTAELVERLDRMVRRMDKEDSDDADLAEPDWERLQVVVPKTELLTMKSSEATEYGFIRHVIEAPRERPLANLMAQVGFEGEPVVLGDTWSEHLVEFLTSPPVAGFLFFLAILFAYVEMHTPGFGVAGAVAIICVALVFGGGYLVGLAQWWEILLIVVGLILIAIEVFLIPGFGVTGVLGGLLVLAGIIAAIVPNAPDKWPVPTTDLGWSMFGNAAFALGVAFVAALVAMPILSKFLPKIPVASRLIIGPAQAATDAPVSDASPMMQVRVGDTGVVIGMCRPVGKVRVGDEIVDAMTEGSVIEAGARVRVMRREGNRLVVERVS